MARVVVIGGGLGGAASAVRLAKLGHEVTLVEQRSRIGGNLGYVEEGGYRWDAGPSTTTLPGALRDLFKKSGRPLDRELDLVELPVVREHRFEDGSRVSLPGSSRTAQRDAIDAGLRAGLGEAWLAWTDRFAPVWDLLRRECLERPYSPAHSPKELVRLMRDRATLARRVGKLPDERLRRMALHHAVSGGHDPRNVPWWMGFLDHVEQGFGVWAPPGGLGDFAVLLEKRLGERGVDVLTDTVAEDVVVEGQTRVLTSRGDLLADVVVCAVDPRQVPLLAPLVERTMPSIPPTVCHVGLAGDVPPLPHEVVVHGATTLTVSTTATAEPGRHAWTISARGHLDEDVLRALARKKIDIRSQVEVRVDRSPRQQVELDRGSSYGVLWQGRRTLAGQLLTRTPYPNVFTAGAHATVSAETPLVALTSALVASAVGRA